MWSVQLHAEPDFSKTQFRVFGTQTTTKPKDLNEVIEKDGLQPYLKSYGVGGELTYEILPYVNAGVRYEARYVKTDRSSSSTTASSSYYSSIQQSMLDLVLRFDLVKASWFKFDIFGAGGLTDTKIDIRPNQSTEGYLTRGGFNTKAGASMALGLGGFYFFVEGGYDWNQMSGFKTEGNPPAVSSLNLSGPYIAGGLILTGELLKIANGGSSGSGSRKK